MNAKANAWDDVVRDIASVMTKVTGIVMPVACLVTPTTAHALGWGVQEEADAVGASRSAASNVKPSTIAPIFTAVTNWVAGIAIAIFVLRVAMTAIDRLLFSGHGAGPALRLSEIPFIGAYPDPDDRVEADDANAAQSAGRQARAKSETLWTWGRIWKRFAIQLGVIAGVWVLMRVLLGVVIMLSQGTGLSS